MSDADDFPQDPLNRSVESPPSHLPAPKRKKNKPRKGLSPDRVISKCMHTGTKEMADIENFYKRSRFQSIAYLNFLTLLRASNRISEIQSPAQVSLIFVKLYKPGKLITLEQINSSQLTLFNWNELSETLHAASINYDLFPESTLVKMEKEDLSESAVADTKVGDFEPQSGFSTVVSSLREECARSVDGAINNCASSYPNLVHLLSVPPYILAFGALFLSYAIYRISRDIVLTVKFWVGAIVGFLFERHYKVHKYSPHSAKRRSAHRVVRYTGEVECGPEPLTLEKNTTGTRKRVTKPRVEPAPPKCQPQSGILPDDGAKYLGKVVPKKGNVPDKPASAPGTSVHNSGTNQTLPRVAPPKEPKKKDSNDGLLNGFGVGI